MCFPCETIIREIAHNCGLDHPKNLSHHSMYVNKNFLDEPSLQLWEIELTIILQGKEL